MRAITKVTTAVLAVGLAGSVAACSSSGSSSSKKPVGQFKTLSGQSTSVALDAKFVQALGTLKLTPGLVGSATMSGTTLSFPITGGSATIYHKGKVTPYVQGTIDHQGSGFSLTGGATKVDMKNFVIDPGNNSKLTGEVDVDGKVFAKSVKLFDLDGNTLKTPTIDKSTGVATLTGTTVYLSSEAAGALNKVFKTNALAGNKKVEIGIATIKATGK